MRRFRTQLAAWWGIDKSIEELQRRLAGMEEAIRTTSTLRTQGLVQILSVYGLPFFISGGINAELSSWLDVALGKGWAALLKLSLYLGLAAALIAGVRWLQRHWVRSWTPSKGAGSAPDSTGYFNGTRPHNAERHISRTISSRASPRRPPVENLMRTR